MENGLFLDHRAKVAVFLEDFDLTPEYLALSLSVIGDPDFPRDYDTITRFSSEARFDVSIERLIHHAMERHQLQRLKSGSRVRSVLVNIPESWPISLEIWRTFFEDSETRLEMLTAHSIEGAYACLGKPAPKDLGELPAAVFYETALSKSPLGARRLK